MNRRPLLICDFDGVIVDGMQEYWWSAKQACIELINPNLDTTSLPEEVPSLFRLLRPWVNHGWEMVLLAAEILRSDSPLILKGIKDFSENYDLRCQQALIAWGWNPIQLQNALENVRRNEIAAHKEIWLSHYRPFHEVIERLKLLQSEGVDLTILTTKGAEFTNELLESFDLVPKLLYGHESGSKINVLLKLVSEYPLLGFIEDRLSTLKAVLSCQELSGLPCYLATWGYIKPSDHLDLPNGIYLLDQGKLSTPLASWH